MRLPFHCPHCNAGYQIPREHDGKTLSCAKCGERFEIHFEEGAENSTASEDGTLFIPVDDYTLQTGKLALKLKYMSREQLKAVLQKQHDLKATGEDVLFGELLVREGVLTEIQRNYVVSVLELNEIRKSDELFGGIVTQNDFTSKDKVDESFKTQKRLFNTDQISRSISEILTEDGSITPQQHDCAIKVQERIQQHIEEVGLSEPIAELLSKEGVITPEELTTISDGDEKEEELIEESLPPPFMIKVSGDHLRASLVILEEATETPSLEAVKEELESQKVIYNLLPDDEIEQFLQSMPSADETIDLATGIAPGKSKDAVIECEFDEDPLKIGHMKANGVVDFKDRGDIPQVKKDELLATKIPREQGENGIDIFGKKIDSRKPDDVKLRCGKGAELSSDRKSVTAKINGKPIKTPAGVVDVLPLLQIKGDVGLETGHIHFDGEIQVKGMVESGFEVTGGSLTVDELDGATVDVRGDLNVKGGIIKSNVRVGGNLKAKYIRKSVINVVGDAAIATEVMQSEIEIGGSLISEKCHLFGSTVGAGEDITFHDIGSDASKPSTITLGSKGAYSAEKEVLNKAIAKQQADIDKLSKNIAELETQNNALNEQIGEAAQVQDKAMVKKRNEPDAPGVDEEMKSAETALNLLFDSQDKIANDIQDLQAKQQEHLDEINHIKNEVEAIDALAKKESESEMETLDTLIETGRKKRQCLHVKGEMFEKTTIKARRTSLTTDTKVHKVSIFEEEYTDKRGIETWRMKVDSLRI
ncbi:MAG: FapA family protein [Chromatiales bacterium]|nr:FapA family protein [Chromatiales bacterium]